MQAFLLCGGMVEGFFNIRELLVPKKFVKNKLRKNVAASYRSAIVPYLNLQ